MKREFIENVKLRMCNILDDRQMVELQIKHIEMGTTKERSITFENAFENIPTVVLTVKKTIFI